MKHFVTELGFMTRVLLKRCFSHVWTRRQLVAAIRSSSLSPSTRRKHIRKLCGGSSSGRGNEESLQAKISVSPQFAWSGASVALPGSCVSKNLASFFQISQEVRMHLRKEFEPPGLVGLHLGDFQNNCGEAGDLGIFRLRHLFQTSHVPFGNVRLLHKRENIVRVFDGLPFAFWLGVA